MTEGPFAETKERIGGLFNIEAKDLDHAIEGGSKRPAAHLGEHESMPFRRRAYGLGQAEILVEV
jgi:hypothetical protein